MVAMATGVVEG